MNEPSHTELARQLAVSESRRLWLRKSLRRRGEEEDVFIWSVADLMMLLLIFFIMLYASQLQRQTSAARRVADRPAPAVMAAPTPAPVLPVPQPESPAAPVPAAPAEEAPAELQRAVSSLLDGLPQAGLSVRWDHRRPVFMLGERITFYAGEAELIEDFLPVLQRIAAFIASRPEYSVRVSGHTDDTPIRTPRFPSNWELSVARALNVARFLTENGVAPERLGVEGYSEFRPLYPNDSGNNRRANRRVEIALASRPSGE
jgi:chemotaxis protein MotB